MKKIALLLLASTAVAQFAHADTPSKVTVNLNELKATSKEGQRLEKLREQKLREFREYAGKKEQEVASSEQMLLKKHQQGELAAGDLQDEMANLERQKRRAGAEIEDKKLEISMLIQKQDKALESKILASIPDIAKEKGWKEVKDIGGSVLFAAADLDKTTDVLSALNKKFEADNAKAQVTGAKKTLKA